MRWLLRKLWQLLVNTILFLFTSVFAMSMIFISGTSLFSRLFWVGLATISAFIFIIYLKRSLSKDGSKDQQGYIILKGTYEYEHRYIAKKILNRNLFPNEVVHHINGKRYDNRLINLCVMDRYQHELFHAWLDWKKKKSGCYPSFEEQKRLLREKHNGILLENPSGFKMNNSTLPVRHTFSLKEEEIRHPEQSDDYSKKLFHDLRQERKRLALERNIPVYLVFKNFTLTEMARRMPQDAQTMASITGVTSEKLRLYGDHFLEVICKYKSNTEELKRRNSGSLRS